MDAKGLSGRVGGTQFDDQVINGIRSTDPPFRKPVRRVEVCETCRKVFVPGKLREHEENHG